DRYSKPVRHRAPTSAVRLPPMLRRSALPLGLCLILIAPAALVPQPAAPAPWFRDASGEYGPIGDGPPAFADLDGDGFPDLICGAGIFKNEGGKRFVDVTKESGVSASGAAAVADVDNDGLPD